MNKIILGVSILFIMVSCNKEEECSYIKDYYQSVYLAEEAYYLKDYQKVVDLMDEACSKCEPLNQNIIYELYKYAESAARIGENEKAIKLVRELILKGYKIERLSLNGGFSELLETDAWKAIEANYDELREIYMQGINLDLRAEIKYMVAIDQHHRYKVRNEGIDRDSIWRIINEVDSTNDVRFKEIIKDFGYPSHRIIGGYNIDEDHIDAGVLLFHFDDYDYYSTTLLELIDRGEAPPSSLGEFIDSYQRRVPEEKRYIYGIYDNVEEDKIIDYENLDTRRVSIGMAPRELYRRVQELKTGGME